MSRSYNPAYWYEEDMRYGKPPPRHWRQWQRMCKRLPELKALVPHSWHGESCPNAMTPERFIELAATLSDPFYRDIFRRIVMEMLADDFKKLFLAHCERMHGWKPQSTLLTN